MVWTGIPFHCALTRSIANAAVAVGIDYAGAAIVKDAVSHEKLEPADTVAERDVRREGIDVVGVVADPTSETIEGRRIQRVEAYRLTSKKG